MATLVYIYFSKIILIFTVFLQGINAAQISNQWSSPLQIPNYEDTARPPLLIADQANNIHVLNYESVGGQQNAIFYRRWNVYDGWTPPTDVILTGLGGGPQTLQGAIIDSNQTIHIIFYIGVEDKGDIYYSNAKASQADEATAWSHPIIIGAKAGPLPFASITSKPDGTIYVFFGSKADGNGVYMVYSQDFGATWTLPLPLSIISKSDHWPAAIRSTIDSQGYVHLVWSLVGTLGVGEEIHYGRLNSEHNALELDTVIAKRENLDYSTTWPDIIDDGSQLILFFQDSFPATRFMSISKDHGNSWSFPIQPFPYIGEYEFTAISKDSNGDLHLVMGNRTSNPEIHGMWYSRWLGNRWSSLEPIISGPIKSDFDPSAPQATIVQGNILFATWWNNVRRDELSGAWYSYKLLDAPTLSLIPNPTITPTATSTQQPETEISGEQAPELQLLKTPEYDFSQKPDSFFPALPVFIGIIPVFLFIAGFYYFKNRKP